jgi:hypothetical protein
LTAKHGFLVLNWPEMNGIFSRVQSALHPTATLSLSIFEENGTKVAEEEAEWETNPIIQSRDPP